MADPKFLEKPGRIKLSDVKDGNRALAGRMTEIGEQILKLGSSKAKNICTGNWDNLFVEGKRNGTSTSFRPGNIKITEFDAQNYKEKPKV